MNHTRHSFIALTLAACGFSANADLAIKPGPIDAGNHFPSYVVDTGNLVLQLCLDGDGTNGMCRFDPASNFPGNLWASTTGFGSEAYYTQARSALVMPQGRRAELTIGLKAGYFSGSPADGKQTVFSRVAYQIQVPGPGIYKVYHPYLAYPACLPEVHLVLPGQPGPHTISQVIERGTGTPFRNLTNIDGAGLMRWDPAIAPIAPAGFVGDPAIAHTVVGSPCQYNVLRIEGPNVGGPGIFAAQTAMFNLTGKLHVNTPTAAALVVDRASFLLTNAPFTSRVDVVGRTSPSTTVALLPVPGITGANTLTRSDANGKFSFQVAGAANPPSTVQVTLDSAQPQATVQAPVTDQVQVLSAIYSPVNHALTLVARTSYKIPVTSTVTFPGVTPGVLTATVDGGAQITMQPTATPGDYSVVIGGLASAPASVTVFSARGGRVVAEVQD